MGDGEQRAVLRESWPLLCRLPEHPPGFWGTPERTIMWGCSAWRTTRKHLCSVHSSAGGQHGPPPRACNPMGSDTRFALQSMPSFMDEEESQQSNVEMCECPRNQQPGQVWPWGGLSMVSALLWMSDGRCKMCHLQGKAAGPWQGAAVASQGPYGAGWPRVCIEGALGHHSSDKTLHKTEQENHEADGEWLFEPRYSPL